MPPPLLRLQLLLSLLWLGAGSWCLQGYFLLPLLSSGFSSARRDKGCETEEA